MASVRVGQRQEERPADDDGADDGPAHNVVGVALADADAVHWELSWREHGGDGGGGGGGGGWRTTKWMDDSVQGVEEEEERLLLDGVVDSFSERSAASLPPAAGQEWRELAASPGRQARAFDTRLQARWQSPSPSIRSASPLTHSRISSLNNGHISPSPSLAGSSPSPWEVVRWTTLRRLGSQVYSESGRRSFGRPTCVALGRLIALGTSKGLILIFDYRQTLKAVLGQGLSNVSLGEVLALAISLDNGYLASGHTNGHVVVWDLGKPSMPSFILPPQSSQSKTGHPSIANVIHVDFVGAHHTTLVSADDTGLVFLHQGVRGLTGRTMQTTRLLGRYPSDTDKHKRAHVFALSSLPLSPDKDLEGMDLVAILTSNLLILVSTSPFAQTQLKRPRPKGLGRGGSRSGCLAWLPHFEQKEHGRLLAYCWSNVLLLLQVDKEEDRIQSHLVAEWQNDESIVSVQWINFRVLSLLTVSQRLLILDTTDMHVADSFDLLGKQILHHTHYAEHDAEHDEDGAVFADSYEASFCSFKGRLFVIGFAEATVGSISNWADRLLSLVHNGMHIEAVTLATKFYTGDSEKAALGLPVEDEERHSIVRERAAELTLASLQYSFAHHDAPISELSRVVFDACMRIDKQELLFSTIYDTYVEFDARGAFFDALEPFVLEDAMTQISPQVVQDFIAHYAALQLYSRLNQLICHLPPYTLDIDAVMAMCRAQRLLDAMVFVWTMALNDFIAPLVELLQHVDGTADAFVYISYTLTGLVYPTGNRLPDAQASPAKETIYSFIFSPQPMPLDGGVIGTDGQFPYLRHLIALDAATFFVAMDEAFEDPFLNNEAPTPKMSRVRSFTRSSILSTIGDVMVSETGRAVAYYYMFVARSLARYPQFIQLNESMLRTVFFGLCECADDEDIQEECQLSVEYLLSAYHPANLDALIPICQQAGFTRVLMQIYRGQRNYAQLLDMYFEGHDAGVFACFSESLRQTRKSSQQEQVTEVLLGHVKELALMDPFELAQLVSTQLPDLNSKVIAALEDEEGLLFAYLQHLLDFPPGRDKGVRTRYLTLLCTQFPESLAGFIAKQDASELEGETLLPMLEERGLDDAVVALLQQMGRGEDALQHLLQQLQRPATIEQLQQYTSASIQICLRPHPIEQAERMWIQLIHAVMGLLQAEVAARALVQQVFTALLMATSTLQTGGLSFPRIFRAFVQEKVGAWSLATLRGILSDAFSSYAYEQQIVTLANRLVDVDLFQHVERVWRLRRTGWRARSAVCEICQRRVWGAGAGAGIYAAWEERRGNKARAAREQDGGEEGKEEHDRGKPGGEVVVFGCGHTYHVACLQRVLQDQDRLHCLECRPSSSNAYKPQL